MKPNEQSVSLLFLLNDCFKRITVRWETNSSPILSLDCNSLIENAELNILASFTILAICHLYSLLEKNTLIYFAQLFQKLSQRYPDRCEQKRSFAYYRSRLNGYSLVVRIKHESESAHKIQK